MQITDLADWDIETQKIEGEYDEDYVASLTQSKKFSVYRTDRESVEACVNNIYAVMHPSAKELEEASITRSKSFVVNYIKMIKDKISEARGDK